MADLVAGGAVGAVIAQAYSDLYKVAKDAVVKAVWCKEYCNALARDLEPLLPIVREIHSHLEFPARECEQYALADFKRELEKGTSLISSCIQLTGWHPIQRLSYGRAIVKLREHVLKRLQNLLAFNTLQLQQVEKCQQDTCKQLNEMQESVDLLLATVTSMNKPPTVTSSTNKALTITSTNKAPLMDWIRQANSPSTPENRADTAHPINHELHIDKFLVGMTDSISQVKSLLFAANELKIVTILGGMGGIGKTTLAIAICKDLQVQEFFQNRVHFFTVSQSPNILGLLSTIWQKVVGGDDMPVFQSEEDASRQLKGRLLGMPYKQLIVLDDVWSKAHLEHLSFEGKRCRTLITTRQAAILETHRSAIFNLGLLNEEDAQSLFCSWAFGQDSIPEWADEGLVKEVISECKRLPLALKVIGGSLSSAARIHTAWLNARDKLRAAETLGDYHVDALQKRLQASIDALDPRLQECFQDLGAFPEDFNSSVDTLLDIWVHVRGMDWTEAVLALVELSSRCLLDFKIHVRSDHLDKRMLEDGTAMSFSFSQHDVMRDLALHLSTQGHVPSQRTRLMMPQRGSNVPKSWLLADHKPLAAQIISINTGAMKEQDWPCMLAFPSAEALLLRFDGDAYHLPPFVQSMRRLKVLLISSSGKLQGMTGSLEGLDQLKSIDMENVALITSPVMLPKLETLRLRGLRKSGGPSSMLESQTLPFQALSVSEPSESCPALNSLKLLCLSEQLGNLTSLVYLGLQDCILLDELPASLCNLRHLEVLDIFKHTQLENLPQNLGELSAMKTMYLSACIGLIELPESLGNLSSLKKLDLFRCSRLRCLPETFSQLEALKELNVVACTSLRGLPEDFGLLPALESLSLTHCSIKHLPQDFGLLGKLKQLDLSFCKELKFLPESFGKLSLKRLSLERCQNLQALPKSFEELSCLEYLSLKDCWNLRHLPKCLGELSCLKYLSLECCFSVERLPESFGRLQRLKELNLKGAEELEALPDSFGELCCLEVLHMGDCEGLKQLPETFGNLRKLRRWEMVGVGLKSLPTSIGVGGLVGLEIVVCSEGLMPLWKARRGDCHPLPQAA